MFKKVFVGEYKLSVEQGFVKKNDRTRTKGTHPCLIAFRISPSHNQEGHLVA